MLLFTIGSQLAIRESFLFSLLPWLDCSTLLVPNEAVRVPCLHSVHSTAAFPGLMFAYALGDKPVH